jgi:hypothetical protein
VENDDCDLQRSDRFERLYHDLFDRSQPFVNDSEDDRAQLAFDPSSHLIAAGASASSDSHYLDGIESFFNINDTFVQQLKSAVVRSEQDRQGSDFSKEKRKIFVGSIPQYINQDHLKKFFDRIGHSQIADIIGPIYKVYL